MKYVHIYADTAGNSHLADEGLFTYEAEFTPPSPAGYSVTDTLDADSVLMMHHPSGYKDAWHCAPAPVFGTVLLGSVQIQTSDGDSRLLKPGDQFLATDLSGCGHKMEEVNGDPYNLALVVLNGIPESLRERL